MNKDYSLDALGSFLDYSAQKGLIKPNTAESRKRAALKILAVLDGKEKQDLRQIDVEHAFERFTNLQGADFKPASLQVFKSRLRSALTDFLAYVEDPTNFKPAGKQRSSSGMRKKTKLKQDAPRETPDDEQIDVGAQPPQTATHLVIPIPIREGLTVKIHNIPADLTKQESEKIASIIKAYAMTEA